MRRLMGTMLALGCAGDPPPDLRTCDVLVAEVEALVAAGAVCDAPSDCGQPVAGLSCGCTRAPVVRLDADLEAIDAAVATVRAASCDLGETTCDCPEAYGFDCVDGACTWDYAEGAHLPDCRTDRGVPVTVSGLAVDGDTLTLTLDYAGGCGPHAFTLCWPDQAFAESSPVQARLEVFHATEDTCEAALQDAVGFDLTPLRAAYAEAYGAGPGVVDVHVGAFSARWTF